MGQAFSHGDAGGEIVASRSQLFPNRRGQRIIAAAAAADINTETLDFLVER